jgi:hypothetical protein
MIDLTEMIEKEEKQNRIIKNIENKIEEIIKDFEIPDEITKLRFHIDGFQPTKKYKSLWVYSETFIIEIRLINVLPKS